MFRIPFVKAELNERRLLVSKAQVELLKGRPRDPVLPLGPIQVLDFKKKKKTLATSAWGLIHTPVVICIPVMYGIG